jgi:hypothetical protein
MNQAEYMHLWDIQWESEKNHINIDVYTPIYKLWNVFDYKNGSSIHADKVVSGCCGNQTACNP